MDALAHKTPEVRRSICVRFGIDPDRFEAHRREGFKTPHIRPDYSGIRARIRQGFFS